MNEVELAERLRNLPLHKCAGINSKEWLALMGDRTGTAFLLKLAPNWLVQVIGLDNIPPGEIVVSP